MGIGVVRQPAGAKRFRGELRVVGDVEVARFVR
jgi:hypothetical protein